jgi:hypothetical protein
MNPLKNEPVWTLVAGLGVVVQGVLILLLAFGVQLTTAQTSAINSLVAVVIAWLLRARVSPITGTQDGSTIFPAGSVKQVAQNAAKGTP